MSGQTIGSVASSFGLAPTTIGITQDRGLVEMRVWGQAVASSRSCSTLAPDTARALARMLERAADAAEGKGETTELEFRARRP